MTRLTLTAHTLLAADQESRTLRGVAIPYGVYGNTSAGRVTVDAGAVTIPENLRTVKLFTDHGRAIPTGYTLEATDTADALTMAFQVGRTPDGDRALLEAAEGIRDALSVELDNVTIEGGHVVAADLVAVAQVPLPAFAGAQLVAALSDSEQADVNALAQQIVDATAPADDTTDTPTEDTAPPQDAAAAATTEQDTRMDSSNTPAPVSFTPAATTTPRALSFAAVCASMAAAHRDGRGLTAALTDIVPAADAGHGALPPQWIGEAWTPVADRRYFINGIGNAVLSSGLKVYGWKWDVFPVVSTYAGSKADVPSSPATTEPIEAPVKRLAGGWDLDRIFADLGEPSFIEAFFQAAVRDLALKQEGDVAAVLLAGATDDGSAADVWAMIGDAAASLAARGAALTFCGLATDLWAEYVSTATATVPWWVPNGANPSLRDQTGNAADVPFFMAPGLPAGTLLAGDRNAATFYEPSPNPVRVNAVNVPNGGIDLGVFGYHAILVNDGKGLSKVTKTVGP